MSSCYDCDRYWYHEPSYEEGGTPGHVCDGLQNPGIVNLKTFPFKRAPERCFTPKTRAQPTNNETRG